MLVSWVRVARSGVGGSWWLEGCDQVKVHKHCLIMDEAD